MYPADPKNRKNVHRVIIADDDPVIRHWLTSILESDGYEVVEARDGREAYRILQSDANFKGSVFDLSMPYLEGSELIRHMRSEKRLMRIPVLMITAESDFKVLADGFSAGATFCLSKPFSRALLQNTLRMMLGAKPSNASATAADTPVARSKAIDLPSDGRKAVDLQILRNLEDGDGGDPALVTELIDLYLESAGNQVTAIKTASVQCDISSFKRQVHALKGSSSTVGANRIAQVCDELETTGGASVVGLTEKLVRELEVEFASAQTLFLAERCQRLKSISA